MISMSPDSWIFPLSTTNQHLPRAFASDWTTTRAFAICLCRDWTLCCCSCRTSIPMRGIQGGEWGTLCSRETGYFQELISWTQSSNLFISRKALDPFMVTSAPVISRNLLGKYVLDCTYSRFTKSRIYWPSPLPLWNRVSELSEVLSPGLQSTHCPK